MPAKKVLRLAVVLRPAVVLWLTLTLTLVLSGCLPM